MLSPFFAIVLLIGCSSAAKKMEPGSRGYTVTYHGNGHDSGSVPISDKFYTNGEIYTVSGNSGLLTRKDYTFHYWTLDKNGAGKAYGQGDTIQIGESNIDLYAKWQQAQQITIGAGETKNAFFLLINTTENDPTLTKPIEVSISNVSAPNTLLRSAAIEPQKSAVLLPDSTDRRLDKLPAHHTMPPPNIKLQKKTGDRISFSAPTLYNVGDTQVFKGEDGGSMTVKAVRSDGTWNLAVWVRDSDFGSGPDQVDQAKVDQAADKFLQPDPSNDIFDHTTAVFGVPWGPHPYGNLIASNEKTIHIAFTDIGNNGDGKEGEDGGKVAGYYWAVHNYLEASQSEMKLLFFMDAPYANGSDKIYSTLIHEFQHMIHFYQKSILKNQSSSAAWYNEMLSMISVDLIAPITAPNDAEITGRIALHLQKPWLSLTKWDNTYEDYSSVTAFGSYLIRNHGGAALVKKIMENEKIDRESVTEAVGIPWETLIKEWPKKILAANGYPAVSSGGYNIPALNTWTLETFMAGSESYQGILMFGASPINRKVLILSPGDSQTNLALLNDNTIEVPRAGSHTYIYLGRLTEGTYRVFIDNLPYTISTEYLLR